LARSVAHTGRLAKVDIVSTVGVAGKRNGTLPEVWLDQMPAFHNTYEQAKAEAEDVVRLAVENEKLPITVHRPSMVIGDSRDGRVIHFQIFYFLCEFLSGLKTKGLYPNFSKVQLDIIPSDTVAAAIVAASRDSATAGRIFHLCSGPDLAPLLEDVKASVRQSFAGHGISVPAAINLPMRWYSALARMASHFAPTSQRKALATLPIYLDYLADRQSFANSSFAAWSAAKGQRLPRWQDYLPKVLDHYLDQRYASSPTGSGRTKPPPSEP
jgi:thioester reductase-like protein